MANVDHGVITPANGPGSDRGNHVIQGTADFANEAARVAYTVLAADVGRVALQTDTTEWFIAKATGTGLDKWQLIGDGILAGANVSGLLTGGVVTINGGDAAEFDIAAGTGIIWDWTGGTPERTEVSWTAFTAEPVTDIATTNFTSLFIDTTGAIVQVQDVNPTALQRRELIVLQQLVHGTTTIVSVSADSQPAYDMVQAMYDYVIALGPVNSGNTYEADAADLTVKKLVGTTTLPFINRINDTQNPSEAVNAEVSPGSAVYTFRDGVGGFTFEPPVSDIAPGLFDDGSGTPAAVSPITRFTIQRLYFFGQTGTTSVTYGQVLYNSISDAEAAIFTENPDVSPFLANASFTTALIVQGNATDLSDSADAKFVDITLGAVSAGGTGAVTSVVSSDADLLTASPTTGDVVLTPINQEVDTADSNTFYGELAGNVGTHSGAVSNAGFGDGALASLTSGDSNTAGGAGAGNSVTTASNTTFFGANAGLNNTQSNTTAFGAFALDANISGTSNTACGYNVLTGLLTGNNNSGFGSSALDASTGSSNTAVGSGSSSATSTANSTTAVGASALAVNTATGSTAIGADSMLSNVSGMRNTAIGFESLKTNIVGVDCVAIGYQSLALSTGSGNVGIGSGAGAAALVAVDTTLVGSGAGLVNTASQTTAFGAHALDANVGGAANTACGFNALSGVVSGAGCTAVGSNAALAVTVSGITAIGAESLDASTSGPRSTAVGFQTLSAITTNGDGTAMGYQALKVATGASNTAFGSQAGLFMGSGTEVTLIGAGAGALNTASQTTAVGAHALDSNVGGTANTACGFNALTANVTGVDSTAVGNSALAASTGSGNTAVGQQSGTTISSGSFATSVGAYCMQLNTGQGNTAVGYACLQLNSSGTGNSAFGFATLNDVLTGSNNSAFGDQSLDKCTGSNNTALGSGSGGTLIGGSDNIFIGQGADGSGTAVSNELNIGDSIFGDLSTDAYRIGGSGAPPSTRGFDLDSAGHIYNARTMSFRTLQTFTSTSNASTADWGEDQYLKHTLTENTTMAFTAPLGPTKVTLVIVQDSTPRTITWPAGVKWPGGTAPTLSSGSGAIDELSFLFTGGTEYLGNFGQDYS